MKHKHLYLIFGFVATITVCNCSKISKKDSNQNTLLVDVGAECASFDPNKTENASEFRIMFDLFAGLVDFDQTNTPIPGMAINWDISKDGTTYTFHLRHDLKFSDGAPITANDFVYSWQRLVDPKTAGAYSFILEDVVNADAIIKNKMAPSTLGVYAKDPYTFVVKLNHPVNKFLSYITTPAAFVVPKHAIEKFGDKWTDPENIVTSGAYILKQHIINGSSISQKNSNYYDAKNVKINTIKYFPLAQTSVGISTYKANELDTTWKNIPIDEFKHIEQLYPNELHITPAERTNHLSINLSLPKYAKNLQLRKALSMAIDRSVLTNKVLSSGQMPLYSIVTPTIEQGKYKDTKYDWANLSRDKQITQAKKLYKEAGYSTINPLKITLSYDTNDLNKKTCLALAAMWKEVLGIDAQISVQELKSFISNSRKGNFDIRLSTWGADYNSVSTYTTIYQCGNGNNYSQYCNSPYMNQIKLAGQMIDPNQQEIAYKKAIKIALDDYPVIPLYQPTQQRLVKLRVHGYNIDKNYLDTVQSKWFSLN